MFLLNRGELEGRFDAGFYSPLNVKLTFNFPTKQLRQITNSFSGGTPDKSNFNYWQGDIPWASPKDFNDFYLTETEDHISEIAVEKSSTKIVPANSVLVVVRSGVLIHTFPVCVNLRDVAINQDLKALVTDESILGKYLGYYFVVFNKYILKQTVKHSTTVQSVNTFEFERLKIPIPPIEIQEQIIEKLDKTYVEKKAKEAEAREKLASVDNLVLDALGITLPEQEENTLAKRIFFTNSSEISNGRFDPEFVQYNHKFESKYPTFALKHLLQQRPQYGANEMGIERTTNDEPRYIRITDINEWGKLIEKDLGKTAETIEDKYILQNNDLLFARSGNTVGKCYLHKDNLPYKSFFAGYMIRFVLDENKVLPDYVFSFTQTRIYKDWIQAIKRTAGQPNINAEEYQTLQIPISPPEVQAEIAERVETIYAEAKQLRKEAAQIFKQAKAEVEKMILGEV